MRKVSGILIILIALAAATANASNLSESEIRNSITDKKVLLETRFGVEFPLYYSASGSVTGDGTGTGLGKYFAPRETGKWWTKTDQLCQQFPTWNNGQVVCFMLEDVGDNILIWRQDNGRSGRAKINF